MVQSKLMKAVVFGAALLMPVINAASDAGDAESRVAVGQRARGESMAQRAETAPEVGGVSISLTPDKPTEDSLGGNETESDSFGATGGGETRVRRNTKEEEDLRKAQEKHATQIDINLKRAAVFRKELNDLKNATDKNEAKNKKLEAKIKTLKQLGVGVIGGGLLVGGAYGAVSEGFRMGADKLQEETLGFDSAMYGFTVGVIVAALGLFILTGLGSHSLFGFSPYFWVIQLSILGCMVCSIGGAFSTEIHSLSTNFVDAANTIGHELKIEGAQHTDVNMFFVVGLCFAAGIILLPFLVFVGKKLYKNGKCW